MGSFRAHCRKVERGVFCDEKFEDGPSAAVLTEVAHGLVHEHQGAVPFTVLVSQAKALEVSTAQLVEACIAVAYLM
jgi:hypothetical protein